MIGSGPKDAKKFFLFLALSKKTSRGDSLFKIALFAPSLPGILETKFQAFPFKYYFIIYIVA